MCPHFNRWSDQPDSILKVSQCFYYDDYPGHEGMCEETGKKCIYKDGEQPKVECYE
jgi:hypothetical protein